MFAYRLATAVDQLGGHPAIAIGLAGLLVNEADLLARIGRTDMAAPED